MPKEPKNTADSASPPLDPADLDALEIEISMLTKEERDSVAALVSILLQTGEGAPDVE